MNIFFLIICPKIYASSPELIDWFYNPNYGVGYVFVANLISTTAVTLALIPVALEEKLKFDLSLLEEMLKYSFPLLALGVVGIMNQTIDKILYPDEKNIFNNYILNEVTEITLTSFTIKPNSSIKAYSYYTAGYCLW
jgi:hypothetical protein